MHKITACLLTFMVGGYSVVFAGQGQHREKCDGWNAIADSLNAADLSCHGLEDCSGVSCIFSWENENNVSILGRCGELVTNERNYPSDHLIISWQLNPGFEVKWVRCEGLPQLMITLSTTEDSSIHYFTDTDVESIKGFSIRIGALHLSFFDVDVVLEKQTDGAKFRLRLEVAGVPVLYLVREVVIPLAPCVTPEELVCQAMQDLADSVTPPTSCSMIETCNGISCEQTYPFSYGTPPTTFLVDMDTDLIINSCDEVSIILTARSKQLNLDWTHTFTSSGPVSVDQDLTFGVKLVVDVTMQYTRNSDNILTTIEYTITQASGLTTTEYILQNAEVCIPNCKSEPPSREPTTRIPNECESWGIIENALEFSLEGGYSIFDCSTLHECRGFECSAMYEWRRYEVTIEEFHCQDPTYISVSIIGVNEQYSQKFTHNETVPIPFAEDIKISVHLVNVPPSMIFVGVTVLFPFRGGRFVEVPLVSDQLLMVSQTACAGHNDNSPLVSDTLIFGGIGLVAIVFAVIVLVALVIYFRRRRQSRDPDKNTVYVEPTPDAIYEKAVSVSLPS